MQWGKFLDFETIIDSDWIFFFDNGNMSFGFSMVMRAVNIIVTALPSYQTHMHQSLP